MDFKIFKNQLARLTAENKLLKFAVVLIALSNVYFGSSALKAVREKKVVLYPVGYCGKIEVGAKEPNEFYVLQMGRFVFDSLLTFTPASIQKQYDAVLAIFDASAYQKFKKLFTSYVEDVKTSKISSVFLIKKIEHSPRKRLVKATGRRIILFGDRPIETKNETFAFTYVYRYGEFRILDYGRFDVLKKKLIPKEENA